MSRLEERIWIKEGFKSKPYLDTMGKYTIGYGRNLTDKGLSDVELDFLGITYVANFQDLIRGLSVRGITEDQGKYLCRNDIAEATHGASTFTWFVKLSPIRQDVVTEMVFNMGLKKLKGFVHTIEFIEAGQFFAAADQMLRSAWAEEVGARATELAFMMEKDEYFENVKEA